MEYSKSSSSSSNAQQQQEQQDFVVDLDPSNFTDTIIKNNFVVVNYHMPLMPSVEEKVYSNAFATEYKKASVILRNNDPPIQLRVYYGPHDAQGIANYLRRIPTPNPAHVKSAVQIGVFPKFSGDEYAKFIAFAEEMKYQYYFGYTKDAKHLPLGETSVAGPLVRLFKPFDEMFVDTKEFDALKKFVKEATRPKFTSDYVLDLDPSNFTETISKHDFVVVHFYDSEESKEFAAEYEKAASSLSSNDPPIVFAQVDVDREVNEELEAQFDIKSYPAVRIFRDSGKKVETLEEVPADAKEFVECLKGLSAGAVDNSTICSDLEKKISL
ncbi:hypothetical protein ACFE04_004006 [Oxalis oulophora]